MSLFVVGYGTLKHGDWIGGNMPRIRIIAIPPDQAPEDIRKGWIGCEFSAESPDEPFPGARCGIREGSPQNVRGYIVNATTAFDELRRHSKHSYDWWEINGFVMFFAGKSLVFPEDVCQVIS